MKLYELANQFQSLRALEDMEPEDIKDTLESLEGEFEDKAKAIVAVRSGMDADVTAIDAEIKRLTAMKKAVENREASLRSYLKINMQNAGITNIKCPLFSITLAKGREVLSVDNESEIPDEYMKVDTKIAPDKKTILDKLKSGESVSGCSLVRSDSSLRIK